VVESATYVFVGFTWWEEDVTGLVLRYFGRTMERGLSVERGGNKGTVIGTDDEAERVWESQAAREFERGLLEMVMLD